MSKLRLTVVLSLLLLLLACGGLVSSDVGEKVTGETALEFVLPATGGDLVKLSSYRGNESVVLVFYHSYW